MSRFFRRLDAASFVRTLEVRQGFNICYPRESLSILGSSNSVPAIEAAPTVGEPFLTAMNAAAAAPIILPSSPRVRFRRVADQPEEVLGLREAGLRRKVEPEGCGVEILRDSPTAQIHHAEIGLRARIALLRPDALGRASHSLRPTACLGRKVSDEYTVPVCRLHHRELHAYGDEASWWAAVSIDPLPIALELWRRSRSDESA